jgi:hypothetical protein
MEWLQEDAVVVVVVGLKGEGSCELRGHRDFVVGSIAAQKSTWKSPGTGDGGVSTGRAYSMFALESE